jgi:hypothetical protein
MNFYIRNLDVILIPGLVLFNQGYLFALFAFIFYAGIKIIFIREFNKPYLFFLKTKEKEKINRKFYAINLFLIKDKEGQNHYINTHLNEKTNALIFNLLYHNNNGIQKRIINELKGFNEEPVFYHFIKNCIVIDLQNKEIEEFFLALMFLKLSAIDKIKIIFASKNIVSFLSACKVFLLNENFKFKGLGYKHKYYGYSCDRKTLKKSIIDFWVMLENKKFKCFYETNRFANIMGGPQSLAVELTKSLLCPINGGNIFDEKIEQESNDIIKATSELPKIKQKEQMDKKFNSSRIKNSAKIL